MSASTSHDSSQDSSHLSIGEVLNILREEFSDITISKIRFLESQGLIDPERTPSGYRKFYEADVARLRWILHQQKENFLPLKVIKERLEQLGDGGQSAAPGALEQQTAPAVRPRRRPRRSVNPDPDVAPPLPFDGPAEARDQPLPSSAPRPSPTPPAPTRSPARAPAAPRRAAAAFTKSQPAPPPASPPPPAPEKAGLTRPELVHASGLEDWQLAELESFGLLAPIEETDKEGFFDEEDLAIAKACAGFYSHGIGARHLRMYKHFAEREAALFEQVSMHYMRQRNPGARAKAQEELAALSRLGRALRAALLVQAIRDALE